MAPHAPLLLLVLLHTGAALLEFPAYRVIQYDLEKRVAPEEAVDVLDEPAAPQPPLVAHYGSPFAGFSLLGAAAKPDEDKKRDRASSLHENVALMLWQDATPGRLVAVTEIRHARAVIMLIPSPEHMQMVSFELFK